MVKNIRNITSVTNVHKFDDFSLQSWIKHVGLTEFGLEISATGQDHSTNVGLVIGYEELNSCLGYFAYIIMSFFHSKTSKSKGRLTTTAVFFRQIHGELVQNVPEIVSDNEIILAVKPTTNSKLFT